MPIKNSAKKAMRQDKKRAEGNLAVKTAYKKAIKAVTKALDAGEGDIKALMLDAQKRLDKAAKKGVIKRNTAARRLSRLSKKVAAKVK